MIGFVRGCFTALSRSSILITRTPSHEYFFPSWKKNIPLLGVRAVNTEFLFARLQFQCFASKKASAGSSRKQKLKPEVAMKDDKEAFFVVRKGDLIGVYKSLNDCQTQVGTSICDPPVSVFKGYSMPKDTEKYLMSCGLKNALYSIRASDITEELFGTLEPCPIQPSLSSRGEASVEPESKKKRPQEAMWSAYEENVGPVVASNETQPKHFKLETRQSVCSSCTLEFDGASKGNPGQAGAGAILRSDDGNLICRLREGLGVATNNVAEYRAFILGLKCALGKGFTSVRVRGDSKLVCMQIQGLWKVKNQNISSLFNEAKKLKDRFMSFQIMHVLRDLNSEADAQANMAVELAEGQVQEEVDK